MARKRKNRQSQYSSKRSARQAASLRKTLATPEAHALKTSASKKSWDDHPERHEQASASIKKSWDVKAVRKRRISGIKKAWTPERRKAQAAATAKIMADPELNARRLAGLRRTSSDPELNALRIANLKKANADPAVRGRKIKKMEQTLHTPEVSARRRATSIKLWADLRAGHAALAEIVQIRNRRRGRPRMDERDKMVVILRARGKSWREIATQLVSDFAKNPEAAMNKVRLGYRRAMNSKK